jgi:hypothetical protein
MGVCQRHLQREAFQQGKKSVYVNARLQSRVLTTSPCGHHIVDRLELLPRCDRADIKVVNSWRDGVLTSVVSRKLVTGSKFDVQFNDLAARYSFGFAAFDNAQVRHAVHYDAMYLAFAK